MLGLEQLCWIVDQYLLPDRRVEFKPEEQFNQFSVIWHLSLIEDMRPIAGLDLATGSYTPITKWILYAGR